MATPTQLPFIPVIIIGAGFSGLAMGAQLKRRFNFGIEDYVIYERDPDYGGTWFANKCKYTLCRTSNNTHSNGYH